MSKFIIIGGMPRSGTTLAYRMVGSHSQVGLLKNEFEFFRNYYVYGKSIREIFSREDLLNSSVDLSNLYSQSPKEAYVQTLLRHSEAAGKSISGEKTPYNEFFYDILRNWLNGHEFKFIHLVRHPLEAAASFKHASFRLELKRWELPSVIAKFALNWQRSVSIGLARSFHDPRLYFLLRYEDLVSDPGAAISRLCEFMDVDIEQQRMLQVANFSKERDDSSFTGNSRYVPHSRIYQADSRIAFLTKSERKTVTAICGELAGALSYSMSDFKPLPPKDYYLNLRGRMRTIRERK